MIHYAAGCPNFDRAPLSAALGYIYSHRLTGTLKVFDLARTSVPFVFWFKRGLPCYSYSRDSVALLGHQFAAARRILIENCVAAPTPRDHKQLIGQQLIGESLVSLDELQEALVAQLDKRLQFCAADPEARFELDEGMDEFGMVPLSSPLLNPMDTAARLTPRIPYSRARDFLLDELARPRVRLAGGKRVPPGLRTHLAPGLLDLLAEPQSVARALEVPSQARTLAFLYAFGFLEAVSAPSPQPAAAAPTGRPRRNDDLTQLHRLIRAGGTAYEVLGVTPEASRQDVKQSYRRLAFAIHPDRVGDEAAALSQEVFGRVVEAYHTLAKERLRVAYDRRLFETGEWTRLGPLERVAQWLETRRAALADRGLPALAAEYQRLQVLATGGRPGTSTHDRRLWYT